MSPLDRSLVGVISYLVGLLGERLFAALGFTGSALTLAGAGAAGVAGAIVLLLKSREESRSESG